MSGNAWKRLGWLAPSLVLLAVGLHTWGPFKTLFLGLVAVFLMTGDRPTLESVVSQAALAEALRQLAFMTRLGVPLLQSLEVLSHNTQEPELRRIWSEVSYAVMSGKTLSAALAAHSQAFPRSVLGMVSAGELTGALVNNLEKVSEMMAREAALKKKVQSSLAYPAMVLALIFGLSLFTLLVIFPSFAQMFRELNLPLPLVTRVLILTTALVTSPWSWMIGLCLAKVGLLQFSQWYARPESRRSSYRLWLRLPLLGPILRYASLTRYCWAFEGVLSAGVPLLRGVRLVAVASGNPLIEADKNHLVEALERGESMAEYFWDYSDLYHPMIASMVSVGEESRRLDRIFGHLAGWFQASLEECLESMSAILEPVLLLLVGLVTGTTLVAIFLPLYGTLEHF